MRPSSCAAVASASWKRRLSRPSSPRASRGSSSVSSEGPRSTTAPCHAAALAAAHAKGCALPGRVAAASCSTPSTAVWLAVRQRQLAIPSPSSSSSLSGITSTFLQPRSGRGQGVVALAAEHQKAGKPKGKQRQRHAHSPIVFGRLLVQRRLLACSRGRVEHRPQHTGEKLSGHSSPQGGHGARAAKGSASPSRACSHRQRAQHALPRLPAGKQLAGKLLCRRWRAATTARVAAAPGITACCGHRCRQVARCVCRDSEAALLLAGAERLRHPLRRHDAHACGTGAARASGPELGMGMGTPIHHHNHHSPTRREQQRPTHPSTAT